MDGLRTARNLASLLHIHLNHHIHCRQGGQSPCALEEVAARHSHFQQGRWAEPVPVRAWVGTHFLAGKEANALDGHMAGPAGDADHLDGPSSRSLVLFGDRRASAHMMGMGVDLFLSIWTDPPHVRSTSHPAYVAEHRDHGHSSREQVDVATCHALAYVVVRNDGHLVQAILPVPASKTP